MADLIEHFFNILLLDPMPERTRRVPSESKRVTLGIIATLASFITVSITMFGITEVNGGNVLKTFLVLTMAWSVGAALVAPRRHRLSWGAAFASMCAFWAMVVIVARLITQYVYPFSGFDLASEVLSTSGICFLCVGIATWFSKSKRRILNMVLIGVTLLALVVSVYGIDDFKHAWMQMIEGAGETTDP